MGKDKPKPETSAKPAPPLLEIDAKQLWQIPEVIELATRLKFVFNQYAAGSGKGGMLVDFKTGTITNLVDETIDALRGVGFDVQYATLLSQTSNKELLGIEAMLPSEDRELCRMVMERKHKAIDENRELQEQNNAYREKDWQRHQRAEAARKAEQQSKPATGRKGRKKKP